jgi:hypothetical protein
MSLSRKHKHGKMPNMSVSDTCQTRIRLGYGCLCFHAVSRKKFLFFILFISDTAGTQQRHSFDMEVKKKRGKMGDFLKPSTIGNINQALGL